MIMRMPCLVISYLSLLPERILNHTAYHTRTSECVTLTIENLIQSVRHAVRLVVSHILADPIHFARVNLILTTTINNI